MSRKQVNTGLERYYKHKKAKYLNDDNIGKFMKWCEDNGFETDVIQEELENMDDTQLGTFDEDDFPTDKTGKDKEMEIIKVIKECWDYKDAFKDGLDFTQTNEYNYFMDNNNMTSISTQNDDEYNDNDKDQIDATTEIEVDYYKTQEKKYWKCMQCSFYNHISSKQCMVCVMCNSWNDKFKPKEYIIDIKQEMKQKLSK